MATGHVPGANALQPASKASTGMCDSPPRAGQRVEAVLLRQAGNQPGLADKDERRDEPLAILGFMPAPLIEFPADDPDRARRFWHGVLGVDLSQRPTAAGAGWEANTDGLRLGVHDRGPGPGDTASLPYFPVANLPTTLERITELGGSVIHPGERWAVCRDSEGSPFALASAPAPVE